MIQFKSISNLILTAILLLSSLCVNAFNLPSKIINGKEYYYYNVQPKETIYSIAHKLGTTKDEIVKHNPSAVDGIKAYDTLYFPKADAVVEATSFINHTVLKKETVYGISRQYGISVAQLIADNPAAKDGIKAGDTLRIAQFATVTKQPETNENTQPAVIESATEPAGTEPEAVIEESNPVPVSDETSQPETVAIETVQESDNTSTDDIIVDNSGKPTEVAIVLPFMLSHEKALKKDKQYTDFYRGFLMALNQLQEPSNIIVRVYDTADSISTLKDILAKDEMKDIDLIIAPEDDDHLEMIAAFAQEHKCHVLNLYNIKNTLHKTNEWVLQGNISQEDMYKSAINHIIHDYKGMTPVFLRNKEHLSDKIKFTTQLQVALDTACVRYKQVSYTDILDDTELKGLNDTSQYVFIPTSSAKKDLISYASALKRFKNNNPNRRIELFGYPEWITFKGSIKEKMHEINTTYYSRFDEFEDSEKFSFDAFKQEFGTEPVTSYPNQALLGYDTALYIINSVAKHGKFTPEYNYEGLQNSFDFIKLDGNAGYSNSSLYFISLGVE
jgi:LysM repeat protein